MPMIVQELNAIQERCGYLPAEELVALSNRMEVPLHRLHEVASFFPHYHLKPPANVEVKVCRDMACHLRGAEQLERRLDALAHELGAGRVEVSSVSCLGQCDGAPTVSINDTVFRGLIESDLRARVHAAAAGQALEMQPADRSPPAWKIDPYEGKPLYEAVRRFVSSRDANAVLAELKAAGLVGMGGASFPTWKKWDEVRKQPSHEKYVVANGDESEPGTFKDRELLRRLPHLLVEGVVLAGLVTGATRGIIYIRHEFKDEIQAVRAAIDEARRQGVCGEGILGSELTFPVEVFVSPGGYICGEESALLEAIEDRRAEPRNKPPYPVYAGLFGKPTVINNVETLSWTPAILKRGGPWYRTQGTNGAAGLRLVSISGDVNRPGVYEVPFGLSVRDHIERCAGGMRAGCKLKAIAPSGPSSGYLPAHIALNTLPDDFVKARVLAGANAFDVRDLPLDGRTLRGIGSMLGAALVVIGEGACMVDMALNTTQFFRNESCGKCVPCRVGSQKLAFMLDEIRRGRFESTELELVTALAQTMGDTSICGLGMVAANPIGSLIRHFREELMQHVVDKRCPAGICPGLAR
jgi:NADH:ubiquinone oxidoreductase subunit F (NADH-binding)/NADH:ubiquinone oxidoreductase subunit E